MSELRVRPTYVLFAFRYPTRLLAYHYCRSCSSSRRIRCWPIRCCCSRSGSSACRDRCCCSGTWRFSSTSSLRINYLYKLFSPVPHWATTLPPETATTTTTTTNERTFYYCINRGMYMNNSIIAVAVIELPVTFGLLLACYHKPNTWHTYVCMHWPQSQTSASFIRACAPELQNTDHHGPSKTTSGARVSLHKLITILLIVLSSAAHKHGRW